MFKTKPSVEEKRRFDKARRAADKLSSKVESVEAVVAESKELAQKSKEELLSLQAEIEQKKLEFQNLSHQISLEAMKRVVEEPPPIKGWADVERVNRIGRQALGMDQEVRRSALSIALLSGKLEVTKVHEEEDKVIQVEGQEILTGE